MRRRVARGAARGHIRDLKTITETRDQYQQADDDTLMAQFCAGDERSARAFDALYARYKDRTWRYFCRNFHRGPEANGEESARDAQQELWAKLIERRHAYSPRGRFAGYLFSMANSVLVDAQRKSLRVVDAATDTGVSMDTMAANATQEPARATQLQRSIAALRRAIGALPIAQRNTFVMHQESGMSYAEIAAATDASTETVKSRLRYARKKLAADLQDELGAQESGHAEL